MTPSHVVAVHESAHAVALAYFGWRIRDVTIIPAGRNDGLATHYGPPPDATPIEDYVIAAAGYEAERKLAGDQEPDGDGSVADFAFARRRLERAIPDMGTCLAAQERGNRLARHVVVTNWPLIQAIARRLERDRHLTGQQILQVIQTHQEGARCLGA